jgi:hypothetical protein
MSVACRLFQDLPNIARLAGLGPEFRSRPGRGTVIQQSRLAAGGDPQAQQCGWLKDRYGVSWQVVPAVLPDMISDPDSEGSQRTMEAMLKMKKLDIGTLQRAFAG